MRMHLDMKVSAAALVLMLAVSALICAPLLGEKPVAARAAGFIEERVEVKTDRAHISLPVFYGLGEQADAAVNAHIARTVALADMLAFVKQSQGLQTYWDARMRYEARAQGNVIALCVHTFTYSGGAYGQQKRYEIYIDSFTGDIYTLEDLFKPRKWEKAQLAMSQCVAAALEAQGGTEWSREAPPLPDNFRISSTGLTLIYDPGTMAEYNEGFLPVEIPFGAIDGFINKKGAFYKALTAKSLDASQANVI